MKTYIREVMVRQQVNKYGKMGYVKEIQVVTTDNIDKYNYRKKIKFELNKTGIGFVGIPNKVYHYSEEFFKNATLKDSVREVEKNS